MTREHALLAEYLIATQGTTDAVIAVGDDVLMLNDRARQVLTPGDQELVLAEVAEALALGRPQQLLVALPSGPTARVRSRPVEAGGIVLVQVTGAVRDPRPEPACPASHSVEVGSGPLWTKCRQGVDRAFRAREWLVVAGEPGTGRTTLARAVHQTHTPAAHLRVLDAGRTAELADALTVPRGTLVLTRVDRLPPAALQAVVDLLEPHRRCAAADRPWVVATVDRRRDDRDTDLALLLSLFARSVEVPALRHHVEDLPELVPHLLARITRGGDVRVAPETLRVLMRNLWPGNVEQLHQVLRAAVGRRRTGLVEPADLPPECRATTRRVLTPLEALERDVIVDVLTDTAGNKAAAARRLGMSRATIYRRIHEYGLSVPAWA
jgi:sigma-54 dependent transcriptional regulator, acetoin dehydrogenase operon transcriptional activator AcoR